MGNAKGERKHGDLNDFWKRRGYSNSPVPAATDALPAAAGNLNYVTLGMGVTAVAGARFQGRS